MKKQERFLALRQLIEAGKIFVPPLIFTQEMFNDLVLKKPIDVEFRVVKEVKELPAPK